MQLMVEKEFLLYTKLTSMQKTDGLFLKCGRRDRERRFTDGSARRTKASNLKHIENASNLKHMDKVMHAGTTVDTFLRENLDWLSRATNWAKFSATAGLGVIHGGHLQQGRSLMAPYLPQSGAGGGGGGGSPYSEGVALYALVYPSA
uniref:Uncharacterized protein n=1 Tax=Lactuca sativa TaxID=4236 RepID=A0A9R1XQN1_LACSA|nr:hypothetical protein LSAT_V11C200065920 [Lactuca sativa]